MTTEFVITDSEARLRRRQPLDLGPFFDCVIAISPKETQRALQIGETKLYALINEGQLEAFKVGKSTKITVDSIRRLIERGRIRDLPISKSASA